MHLVGPDPEEERLRETGKDPTNVVDQLLHSCTGFYQLVSYDQIGVTLAPIEEDPIRFFVPWGAVLQLLGSESEETPDGLDSAPKKRR
jgi:hypothetical protein